MKNNQEKSNRGGSRPGAGRPKGSPNKATAEIKELAQEYGEDALKTLAQMMLDPKQPGKTRVSAANALLDRGYGKAAQTLDANVNLSDELKRWLGRA